MKEDILLLDDDLTSLTVLERALGGAGFNCITSADPKQALTIVSAKSEIAVIVTDLYMPHMSGLEFAKTLGETPLGRPILINAGRGGLQRDSAILRALNDGRLMEASLDVFEREPLAQDSPLWRHPQVVLTQHTGGRFPGETDRKLDVFLANFTRLERGEPLQNLVAVERGY